MPEYRLTLVHEVTVYGIVVVEADSIAAAAEIVRDDHENLNKLWDQVNEVDYSTSYNYRILAVETNPPAPAAPDYIHGAIQISEPDDSTPLSADEVLAAVTAARLSN